ncbi:MAG: DUF3857 domain-containing protein [Acidobacteria bacterium]|nr:DUF3857 domain-containing protein [Acidobacteriota bacterium]
MRAVLAGAAVLLAAAAESATILERKVELHVAVGSLTRSESWLVAIQEDRDVERWAEFSITVGLLEELTGCTAEVLDAAGKIVHSVPRRRMRRIDSPGSDLFSSSKAWIVPFPGLAVGQRVRVRVETRESPVFPASAVDVLQTAGQESLEVVVSSELPLRWHLANPCPEVAVTATEGGIRLRGSKLPRLDPPERAPDASLWVPALHIAWGSASDWAGIGRWYTELVGSVPRGRAEVAALARTTCAGIDGRRRCLEALAAHVQRAVRYEAVAIGAGGWVPAPAHEVLARGWGDCKEKSNLLVELLAAAGIRAHLVLLHAGDGGMVERELATPYVFNHCIVAAEIGPDAAAGDPVVGGLVLVDPTSTEPGIVWLPPSCQGRPVLLVDGERSRWLEVPDRFELEGRALEVRGRIGAGGELVGEAALEVSGLEAALWLAAFRSVAQDRVAVAVHEQFTSLVPGASFARMRWAALDRPYPSAWLAAELTLPGALREVAGRRSLRIGPARSLPEARLLDGRTVPLVLDAGVVRSRWVVGFPAGACRPVAVSARSGMALGALEATVTGDAEQMTAEWVTRVERSWAGAGDLGELAALCRAEGLAERTRVRLDCEK